MYDSLFNHYHSFPFSFLSVSFKGFSVVVVDEDGTQQLHITNVKAGGMAFTKGEKIDTDISM